MSLSLRVSCIHRRFFRRTFSLRLPRIKPAHKAKTSSRRGLRKASFVWIMENIVSHDSLTLQLAASKSRESDIARLFVGHIVDVKRVFLHLDEWWECREPLFNLTLHINSLDVDAMMTNCARLPASPICILMTSGQRIPFGIVHKICIKSSSRRTRCRVCSAL